MHILVIGRAGQVARELTRAAWPADWTVTCLGRDGLDLTQPGTVLEAVLSRRPALVINAAAHTAVDRAESEPDLAYAVNRDGAAAVAAAAALIGAPVIHLSTDYVFSGDRADGGYGEADPTGPRSVYGASKLAGEIAVRERQPDAVILRTSWVFSAQGSNFVRTLLRLGAERPELRIVDDQTGCPTAAADIAAAIVVLARQMLDPDGGGQGTFDGTAPGFGTLHFCGIAAVTWFGFALEIFRPAGVARRCRNSSRSQPRTGPRRPLAPRARCSIVPASGRCTGSCRAPGRPASSKPWPNFCRLRPKRRPDPLPAARRPGPRGEERTRCHPLFS